MAAQPPAAAALDALKFSAAVPRSLAVETVGRRLSDPEGVYKDRWLGRLHVRVTT
jgi:hypothetical protein